MALVRREAATVVRTPTYLVLIAGVATVLLGLAMTAAGVGYVPTVLTLLTPVEVLVPALSVAFGYRAMLGDTERGEREMLLTFPVTPGEYVLGVYLARGAPPVGVVVGVLGLVATVVAVGGGADTDVIVSHSGADSLVLFGRFVFLTAVLGLVALGVALAVSTVARSARDALSLALLGGGGLVVGVDLALIVGLDAGIVHQGTLGGLVAVSPASAYRGLVLDAVVGPVYGAPVTGVPVWQYAASLLVWLVAPPLVATRVGDR
jgi:ABC-2 type transport system permease protein